MNHCYNHLQRWPFYINRQYHQSPPLLSSQIPVVWVHRRRHQTTTTTTTPKKSNRQLLKEIPIDSSLLNYIQSIGVGIPSRITRKQRKQQQQQQQQQQDGTTTNTIATTTRSTTFSSLSKKAVPLPFGPYRSVRILSSISAIHPPPSTLTTTNTTTHDPTFSKSQQQQQQQQQQSSLYGFPLMQKDRPEIIFMGRSNVGKSTLLNTLLYANRLTTNTNTTAQTTTGRASRRNRKLQTIPLPKGIKAITSSKPGETQSITFYQLSSRTPTTTANNSSTPTNASSSVSSRTTSSTNPRLCLIDIPGYGFSYMTSEIQHNIQQWIITLLLQRSKQIKRILLLIDARHGIKQTDMDFLKQLEQQLLYTNNHNNHSSSNNNKNKKKTTTTTTQTTIHKLPPIQLVLTKCDLVSQKDLVRRIPLVRQQLSVALRRETSRLPILLVSTKTQIPKSSTTTSTATRQGGGIWELQKELASLVPTTTSSSTTTTTTTTRRQRNSLKKKKS